MYQGAPSNTTIGGVTQGLEPWKSCPGNTFRKGGLDLMAIFEFLLHQGAPLPLPHSEENLF